MDTSYIGKPIHYVQGPNAGKTIRAELSEYQKPDLGRKFAKRDRRPLDPPPVVRVRLWEVFDAGLPSQTERELSTDDVEVQGLVAHVDLFHANTDGSIHDENPAETASLTKHCFGSSFVHATHILDLTGQPAIIFVFADLSVRLEGVFALRYRIFDLVSRVEGSAAIPVAAELYGGIFTVYSTKEFPGLQASTPLTKHLSRWGVRVNLREGERKRKAGFEDDDDDDDDDEGHDEGGAEGGEGSSSHQKKAKPGRGRPPKAKRKTLDTASFSNFQQPEPPHLQQVEQVTPTPPAPPPPPSIDDKSVSDGQGQHPPQQWVGAPVVSWSRAPLANASANTGAQDWARSPATEQSISISAGEWNQQQAKTQQQVAAAPPPKKAAKKKTRMTLPSDTPPGLSQASPEEVANLSSSGRMLGQSPNFIAAPAGQQQPQQPNYAHVLAAASYTPSSQPPPALVQRTSSFGPGGAYSTIQSPMAATQSPIGMHSTAASFAIPSATTQYGYRSGR